MTTPNQMREIATRLREIAAATKDALAQMLELELGGGVAMTVMMSSENATGAAVMLEERANHLERMPK